MDNTELIFKPSIREDAQAQRRVREWIAALRSGKYEQCQGRLHLEADGFCCLGVLLNQVDSAAWKLLSSFNAPDRPGNVEYNDSLTRLNDDGIPFAKIADKIEHDLDAVLAG